MAQLDEAARKKLSEAEREHGFGEQRSFGESSDLQSQISELRQQLGSMAQQAKGAAQSGIESAEQKLQERFSDAEAQIRRNPVMAAAIAAGLGFVIGALVNRK